MMSTVIARRGQGGYAQYRIPALAVTTAGTVLAAYDGRPNLDDLPSPIDLLIRRSTDGGASWGPQQVVRTGTGLQGYGDPSLLVDRATGRILLFHAAGTLAGFFEAVEGSEPDDAVQHVDVSISDDDGLTWTHRRLTSQLKRPGVTGIFAASGTGLCVPAGPYAGRLVQPMVLLEHGEITAAAAYSDDHGESWTLGAALGGHTNESAITATADGMLLLHSRARPRRRAAVSADGGASWSTPEPVEDLPDPSDNGSLVTLADGALLASNNLDPDLRRNTGLSLSRDGGSSWPHRLILCAGSSEYSCAVELDDSRIGVLYEREGYSEIVFTVTTRAELEASGPLDRQAAGLTPPDEPLLEVILRSVTPGLPDEWVHVGEHHVYPVQTQGVAASEWKEVGQAYAAAGGMILGTREAQLRNYGPPRPGLRAGDILAFHARVRLPAGVAASAVVLEHPGGRTDPVEIAAGGRAVFGAPYPTLVVTEADVDAGVVIARFAVPALGLARELRYSTATGEPLT
ncbi:sialidase family protein [Microbacterium luticocti]|uniref:sialidase family protein n=1 Tax=Microbacterium luticocti TaxID=451764 RepID=UPI00056ABE56|nr:sialidase family protein [Microbacterium luticocti]